MCAGSAPVSPHPGVIYAVLGLRGIARQLVVVLACLLPVAVQAQATSGDGPEALSRFQRTAVALQGAEPEVRGQFASAALNELLEIYIAESDLARSEALADGGEKKLYAWSLAVDRYANSLETVLFDIDQGHSVEIGLRREASIALRVNSRQIMLTHPRHSQQFAYEQRVLLEFCRLRDCERLTESRIPLRLPLYSDASAPQPSWVFTENDTVCAFDGIEVFFDSVEGLAGLRNACQQFFQEVSDLLTEISWQQLHGAAIEWDTLTIRPTPGQTEHFVRLNTPGDTVLASLPMLYANAGLLQQLAPWLRDRSRGQDASLVLDGSRWTVSAIP